MKRNLPYLIEPDSVKFDPKFVDFSTKKTEFEYEALKELIRKEGQLRPILMRGGLCGDGQNRVRIAKELKIKVLAEDVDPDISDAQMILLCNLDSIGGKNPTATQKAIQGYKLSTEFGYSDVEAGKLVGLPRAPKVISYIRYIANSPIGKSLKLIDSLYRNESVVIAGKTTKSIELAKKYVQFEEEAELRAKADVETTSDKIVLDYNTVLKTETAKEEFWRCHRLGWDSLHTKLLIAELLNGKYRQEIKGDE